MNLAYTKIFAATYLHVVLAVYIQLCWRSNVKWWDSKFPTATAAVTATISARSLLLPPIPPLQTAKNLSDLIA